MDILRKAFPKIDFTDKTVKDCTLFYAELTAVFLIMAILFIKYNGTPANKSTFMALVNAATNIAAFCSAALAGKLTLTKVASRACFMISAAGLILIAQAFISHDPQIIDSASIAIGMVIGRLLILAVSIHHEKKKHERKIK